MSLRVYNTMTRTKEEFIPRDPGRATIYFCGPTPYSHTHIGHLRPALTGDVVARYLRYCGFKVLYVSNFTDIDDKIINRAREEGVTPLDLSARYSAEYLDVIRRMGIDQVDLWVKVSEHIGEIIAMIQGLLDRGYAYTLDGDVYYDIIRCRGYGKLSRRSLDEMLAGARVAVDERKRHPMDFALWKGAKEGEPAWESPWGPGRPGWHIECSAMSIKYLGNGFDLHGGGDDLIFPHHENEIAQAEGFTGQSPFVRYWVHNGMIQINEEKMSKSLGNFITAGELLDRASPGAIRLFMFTTHYRSPLNFSWRSLKDSERAWARLGHTVEHLKALAGRGGAGLNAHSEEGGGRADGEGLLAACERAKAGFKEAMDDDFNTALALASIFDLAREANTHAQRGHAEGAHRALAFAAETLEGLLGVLGFTGIGGNGLGEARDELAEGLIEFLVELRDEARAEKNWPLSDRIRDRLGSLGVIIEDTKHGTIWRR